MFQLGVAVESMWPLSLKSYAALVKNWRIWGESDIVELKPTVKEMEKLHTLLA